MKELEALLNQRWVLKAEDKELYYRIRDAIGEVRKFASDKLGCQVMENALLVKMEKIPVIPENFMGILDFTSREEYAFLCILLMFLEEKDAGEQFILSQLTEYLAANMPGETVDWTVYTSRRRLIKVLRYAVSQGILAITDGTDDLFMDDAAGEVLYENTGVSRYFMRNFSKDITEYVRPEDFLESDWFAMDEDRGIARRHRVYKRLMFAPGMYRAQGAEEDFEYLKYYGRRLADDLEQNFDCHVHIHKGSAYLMTGEDCHMGVIFPGNNVLSDILLLCLAEIRQRVERQEWHIGKDEVCIVDTVAFEQMLREIRRANGNGFTKNYREMTDGEYVQTVMDTLELWMFIKRNEGEHLVEIYPAAGKLAGAYPDDFAGGTEDEHE